MSVGVSIINASGYLTFDDVKTYQIFEEKIGSDKATVVFQNRFYWDTDYTGDDFPLVFIYSNGYWASIMDVFRLSNNKWRIHVWVEGTKATETKDNISAYLFTVGSNATTDPDWGLKINDVNGDRIYDSDFNLLRVKDFVTMPTPQDSYAGCSSANTTTPSTGIKNTNTTSHGISALSKPAALLYSSGFQASHCQDFGCVWYDLGYPVGTVQYCGQQHGWKSVQRVTDTSVQHGWANMGAISYGFAGFTIADSNKTTPSAYITPVIDGADYD